MSDEDMYQLRGLMDHVGVGLSGSDHVTLMELMNITMHCLGGIRLLVATAEKERAATRAANEFATSGELSAEEAMCTVFAGAVKRMIHAIVLAVPLDDLDPSRHLVESFPYNSKIGTSDWLSIHWAVLGNELYDSGVDVPMSNGTVQPSKCTAQETKIHEIAEQVSLIDTIVKTYPETAQELDKEGRSVLHYASRLSSPSLVECVMKFSGFPRGFGPNQANLNGAFPLHNAARFSKSLEVLELVKSLDPTIVALGNNDGTLPIHWAAAKNSNLDIIHALIKAYPEAMKTPNNEGYLPLHSAGQNSQLHIVQAIHAADPSAISVCDREGGVPMHHTCCFNSNVNVIRFMDNLYSPGIAVVQSDGITPFHLAASQNSSVAVTQYLAQRYQPSALVADDDGWLPLHCLVTRHRNDMTAERIECLRILLAANPAAVLKETLDGLNPYQIAKARGHRDLILRLMLFSQPDYDKVEFARLNWGSYRRIAILACLSLHWQFAPKDSSSPVTDDDDHDNFLEYSDNKIVFIMNKLTDGYLGQSGLSIKSNILRYIIKFL